MNPISKHRTPFFRLGTAAVLCLMLMALLPAPVRAEGGSAVSAFSAQAQPQQLVPVGQAVGIKLFSDGVLVVGLSSVKPKTAPRSRAKPAA